MKKSVLKEWMRLMRNKWDNIVWLFWFYFCILSMCLPFVAIPFQVILTTFAKAVFSPIKPIAEWIVRYHSVSEHSDKVFLIMCADCGRILFVSWIIVTIVQFLIALAVVYTSEDNKENIVE